LKVAQLIRQKTFSPLSLLFPLRLIRVLLGHYLVVRGTLVLDRVLVLVLDRVLVLVLVLVRGTLVLVRAGHGWCWCWCWCAGAGGTGAGARTDFQVGAGVYRQEGQAPFGGYYALPGISPYGGVFGFGTEQFEQQSDPFSGAQARAQEMIRNRISPSTVPLNFDSSQADPLGAFNLSMSEGRFQDAAQIAQRAGYSPDVVADYINANRSGLNLDSDFGLSGEDVASFYSTTGFPRQPAAFGGSMSSMGTPSNPFMYRQSLSPTTLTAPEAAAVSEAAASEAAASEVSGRRGGYIDQGIAAVRR
jgi:hypothetical protein